MKRDRLADLRFDLVQRAPDRNATRQVGDVGGIVIFALFDHHRIAHGSILQPRLPQNAAHHSRMQILVRLARRGDASVASMRPDDEEILGLIDRRRQRVAAAGGDGEHVCEP